MALRGDVWVGFGVSVQVAGRFRVGFGCGGPLCLSRGKTTRQRPLVQRYRWASKVRAEITKPTRKRFPSPSSVATPQTVGSSPRPNQRLGQNLPSNRHDSAPRGQVSTISANSPRQPSSTTRASSPGRLVMVRHDITGRSPPGACDFHLLTDRKGAHRSSGCGAPLGCALGTPVPPGKTTGNRKRGAQRCR